MPTPTLHEERNDDDIQLKDGEVLGTFDDHEDNSTDPTPDSDPAPADDIPEKYRGKTPAELIAMHQEAERFNGKQSSEVGELRRSVDALIQAQLAPPVAAVAPQPVEEEAVDFFDDPDKAVEQKIANHPAVKQAEATAQQYARATAETQLLARHPDMNNIVRDDKFLEWVKSSPVRTRLFQQAHAQYDYEAADELFSTWKERAELAQQTVAVEKQERKQAVQAANTGNVSASAEGAPRKMYRRADIIRLMNEDPERYAAMSDEIMQAYADKRVIT